MDIEDIKKIDIISYLAKSGIMPSRNSGKYAFYLSPISKEKEPSFCVNKAKNTFKDFSSNKSGSILDFVMAYNNLDFKDALAFLKGENTMEIKTYEPLKIKAKSGVQIHDRRKISNKQLISKLTDVRCLDYDLLNKYTVEADISFPYGKNPDMLYTVIGMENDMSGIDFRGLEDWLKMSSAPKTYTTIQGDKSKYAVYEGWLDFISHLQIMGVDKPKYQSYVLNGLGQMKSLINFIGDKEILYYLDNDKAADNLLNELSDYKIRDMRFEYAFYKDINEYLQNI